MQFMDTRDVEKLYERIFYNNITINMIMIQYYIVCGRYFVNIITYTVTLSSSNAHSNTFQRQCFDTSWARDSHVSRSQSHWRLMRDS